MVMRIGIFVDEVIDMATKLTRLVTIFSAVCIAAMLIINITEVIGSKWFNWSLIGYLELTEQLMVAVSILPLAYIALERGHIRITMVTSHLPAAVSSAIEVLGYVLGILAMAFCTWRSFEQMQYALNTKLATNTLSLPVWPTNSVIMIGFGLLFFAWLLLLLKKLLYSLQMQ